MIKGKGTSDIIMKNYRGIKEEKMKEVMTQDKTVIQEKTGKVEADNLRGQLIVHPIEKGETARIRG